MARDVSNAVAEILLSIRQNGACWLLECPDGLEPLEFGSPAEAEERAQLLAKGLTAAGIEVRLHLHGERPALLETAGLPPDKA